MLIVKTTVKINPAGVVFNGIATKDKRIRINKEIEMQIGPFVPMQTGALLDNTTVDETGITYNSPYAKRLYEGEGFNFSKEKHPLATAHWDKAAMASKGEEIERSVERILKDE